MKWDERLVEKSKVLIGGLMRDYLPTMEKAYLNAGDKPLTVRFGLKIKPNGDGLKLDADMKFVVEEAGDTATGTVTDQVEIEFEEEGETHTGRGMMKMGPTRRFA